jgi:hypothetical protein
MKYTGEGPVHGPDPPSPWLRALRVSRRIGLVWRLCTGAQGAWPHATAVPGPGSHERHQAPRLDLDPEPRARVLRPGRRRRDERLRRAPVPAAGPRPLRLRPRPLHQARPAPFPALRYTTL